MVLRMNLGRDCSVEGGSGPSFKETPYLSRIWRGPLATSASVRPLGPYHAGLQAIDCMNSSTVGSMNVNELELEVRAAKTGLSLKADLVF